MSVYLAPSFGVGYQGFDSNGQPLNAGLIYTYIAGGTTPQATYTTSAGNVQNANPIQLDADGRTPSEVWLSSGVSYRFDVKDSNGNLLKTYDNITGINDPTAIETAFVIPLSNVAGTNTITGTGTPTVTAYTTNQQFVFIPANANTGATTLNVDSVGAKNLFSRGAACVGNELIAGIPAVAIYDGTQFNLVYPAKNAALNIASQTVTGGVIVTSDSLGTISSGTVTPNPGDRPLQHYTNNGAHTLAPSANSGSVIVDVTNGASAGAVTTSGFTLVTGAFTTTNGNKFRCFITIGNGGSLLQIQALQ